MLPYIFSSYISAHPLLVCYARTLFIFQVATALSVSAPLRVHVRMFVLLYILMYMCVDTYVHAYCNVQMVCRPTNRTGTPDRLVGSSVCPLRGRAGCRALASILRKKRMNNSSSTQCERSAKSTAPV